MSLARISDLGDFAALPRFRPPIDFRDILRCCRVEDDPDHGMPWEEHDGYEHELIPADDMPDPRESDRTVYESGRYYVVRLDPGIGQSIYEFHRARGATRQVARELAADEVSRSERFIADCYDNGFSWYGVVCDPSDIDGIDPEDAVRATESVWGVDSLDYAEGECSEEIASEVAANLESLGYRIVNKPGPITARERHAARLKYGPNVNSQNRC